jgi:hypothetical protein
MSAERIQPGLARSRAGTIRERMHADMQATWNRYTETTASSEEIIDSFCEDAMHQVEILLAEMYQP